MKDRFGFAVEPVNNLARPQRASTSLAATNTSVRVLDGNWSQRGVHITSIASSNVGLVKGGFISKKKGAGR